MLKRYIVVQRAVQVVHALFLVGLLIHIKHYCDREDFDLINHHSLSLHHIIFNNFTDYYTFALAILYSLSAIYTLYVAFRGYISEIQCCG